MKVLEIKNNLVKVSYNAEDNLKLGGFVVIEDELTPYVAQVVSLKADNGIVYAIVKLIFTFNEEGIVKNYDGSIPSLDANLTKLSASELLDILPIKNPLKLGNLTQEDFVLKVDSSILENNLLICSDNENNTNTFISNCAKQLENNAQSSVIFDINGSFENENKLVFGKDFKLPLNFDTINFIYANDLNDVDAMSKAVIQDIFLEVQEFTRSVAGKFIPFDTFIEVVSQQYKESGMAELALLKNKLLKYKEENVFAQSKEEIKSIEEYIKDHYTVVLDISSAGAKLQKEIIFYVYGLLDKMLSATYTFVEIDNNNSDKKLLKLLLKEDKVYSNIVCSHNYKYIYELKEKADNLVLFAPETTTHDFAGYNTFLNKLNSDEFIVWGSATQHVPLLVEIAAIEIVKPAEEKPEEKAHTLQVKELEPLNTSEIQPAVEEQAIETQPVESMNIFAKEQIVDFTDNDDTYDDLSDDLEAVNVNENLAEFSELEPEKPAITASNSNENIEPLPFLDSDETFTEQDLIAEPVDIIQNTQVEQDAIESETFTPETLESETFESEEDVLEALPEIEIPQKTELIEEDIEPEDEIVILNESFIEEPAPLIGEATEEIEDKDALIEKVAKDVDEAFIYSKLEQEDTLDDDPKSRDILTEDDLNFIEDINQNETETTEELTSEPEIIEETEAIQDNSEDEDDYIYEPEPEPTPVVPVYPAEKHETAQTFEQGDRVSHPKYGEGVVEKMIKYGNKTLCSINFVNVGRRLLDPAISEITKQ